MSPEPEPYHEDDDEYAPQSIFAAGWFRAVLVLTVLAIVVVVSLPYLLNWFEPAPPSAVSQPAPPTPSAATPAASAPASPPRPTEPAIAAPKPAATAPVTGTTPAPKATTDKSQVEKAPASKPVKVAETKPAPDKVAKAAEPKSSPALPAVPKVAGEAKPTPAESKPARVAAVQPTDDRPAGKGEYWVQIGVFKEEANAQALAKTLRSDGFPVEVTRVSKSTGGMPAGTYHLVRAGSFPDLAGATKARDALRAKGHQGFVAKGSTS